MRMEMKLLWWLPRSVATPDIMDVCVSFLTGEKLQVLLPLAIELLLEVLYRRC